MTEQNGRAHIEDMRRFWRHLFGKERGFLCVMSADRDGKELVNVMHKFFEYPHNDEAAAEHSLSESSRGRETYYTVHLLKEATDRKKKNAAAIISLWADLDGAPVPEDPKPTVVLESSPGRFHVGWRLNRAVTPQEAEKLNRRLTYAIGADKGKWALASVLRAPHTTNNKRREDPWEVKIAELDAGREYDFRDLDRLLAPPSEASTNGHVRSERVADDPPVRLGREARRIWDGDDVVRTESGGIDRSKSLHRIGGVLARSGADTHAIVTALRERDAMLGWNKFTQRDDGELRYSEIAAKVIADAERAQKTDRDEPSPDADNAPPSEAKSSKRSGGGHDAPTDDELRDRYLAAYPDYAYGLGRGRRYRDGIWHEVEDFEVSRGICEIMEDAKDEDIRPSQRLLSSIETLTRVKVSISDKQWDADPDILVCTNGALNLATRELLDHSKAHYATAGVPYAYSEDARSEAWERVLDEVVKAHLDEEGVQFLQEFAGYSLTPRTDHEIALWLTGPHGGGRSTILAGIGAMLGPKAGVLSLADIERSSFALTNLPGKTLVTATEQPAVFLRGGGTLNAIISGEPIQVNRKYRDPITVTPRAKIAWAMNELPRVGNNDDGIFRRVKILEFPEIPPKSRDPQVKEDVKASGAAILNWSLDGLARLTERGHFHVPKTIQDATKGFKETNDVPAMFIDEACERLDDMSEAGQKLYETYKAWCLDNGHKPLASNNAAREWKRLGFAKTHTREGTRWTGVRITDEAWRKYGDRRIY